MSWKPKPETVVVAVAGSCFVAGFVLYATGRMLGSDGLQRAAICVGVAGFCVSAIPLLLLLAFTAYKKGAALLRRR